jgi:hypothetical protein
MIQPEDLDKIPSTHRHMIGLWLAERATLMRQGPRWLGMEVGAADALWGAAADLIDPLSEDSTLAHAHDVLRHAGASMGSDADTSRSTR